MSLREFVDGSGREWRAWDIIPDELSSKTRDETYLAQLYQVGWIVFETKNGDDKRRLYPIPKGWMDLPDPELDTLLGKADVVPQRKRRVVDPAFMSTGPARGETHHAEPSAPSAPAGGAKPAADANATALRVVRTFRYPSGRVWAACVMLDPHPGATPVLRFAAGARIIDLAEWPHDWATYSEGDLVSLLRRASPRPASGPPNPTGPRRRWTDRPEHAAV